MDTLWPHVSGLVLQGLGVCHRTSYAGHFQVLAALRACLVSPFLPFLGLDLPLLSSVIKGIGGCLDHLI